MYKKITWIAILSISIITALVFSFGFISSIRITNGSYAKSTDTKITNTPEPESKAAVSPKGNSYNILVLGDSLGKGTGDEKGLGFANNFAALWKVKTNKPTEVNNISVNGDVSSGLLEIIQKEETQKAIKDSNIIFISIGGNEVKTFQNNQNTLKASDLKDVEDNYLSNLKKIFTLIRSKNTDSSLIFIGLYNPYGESMPQDKIRLLQDWNYKTEQLVSLDPKAVFIPTYDLFKYNLDNYLAPDKFHPNSQGYQAISNRIMEVLKN